MDSSYRFFPLTALIVVLGYIGLVAQSNERLFPIKKIGISTEDTFDDLEALGEAMGDAKIVELVDWADAADGTTYEAMSRVITYLHQVHDFDVLIWPIGIFEGGLMQEALERGNMEEASMSLDRVWRESEAIHQLISYIGEVNKRQHKLRVSGGSCQFHAYAKQRLIPYLDERHQELGVILRDHQRTILDSLWNKPGRLKNLDINSLNTLQAALEEIRRDLDKHSAYYSRADRLLQNMIWFVKLERIRGHMKGAFQEKALTKLRLESTLNNFRWLINGELRDKKILLFGSWKELRRFYKDDIYTLGFTTYSGETGRPGQEIRQLEPTGDSFLETTMEKEGHPYIFVLPEVYKRTPLNSRLSGAANMDWSSEFDGIFFISESRPNARMK